MNPEFTNIPRNAAWPFWVLELAPVATNADIEKSANTITAKLKLNVEHAENFKTPFGRYIRDEHLVREARSLLQDPASRLIAEFFYKAPENKNQKRELSISEWHNVLGATLWVE